LKVEELICFSLQLRPSAAIPREDKCVELSVQDGTWKDINCNSFRRTDVVCFRLPSTFGPSSAPSISHTPSIQPSFSLAPTTLAFKESQVDSCAIVFSLLSGSLPALIETEFLTCRNLTVSISESISVDLLSEITVPPTKTLKLSSSGGTTVLEGQNANGSVRARPFLLVQGTLELVDLQFSGFSSSTDGSVVRCDDAAYLTIRQSIFRNNSALRGGAIFLQGSCKLRLENSVLEQNRAQEGGSIYIVKSPSSALSGSLHPTGIENYW